MSEMPAAEPGVSTLSRAWDEFDAYLFDIDGTLIQSTDAVHYFAFCESLSEVAGQPVNLEGVVAHGNVDGGILRDAWLRAGVPEASWRPRLPAVREAMCRFVAERTEDLRIEVLPAARAMLEHLRAGTGSRTGARRAVLGTATGNLQGIGEAKLRRAGLLELFDFGGWSDGFEYRHEVFRAALAQARGRVGADGQVCVVGDTPEDIRAARHNGLEVIAVRTGIYSFEELLAEGPQLCVATLLDLPGLSAVKDAPVEAAGA